MVKIRLARKGSKKDPFFIIVVTDSRKSRTGSFIEKIGFFNPLENNKKNNAYLNFSKIEFWKKHGAILSNRVQSLIKNKIFKK